MIETLKSDLKDIIGALAAILTGRGDVASAKERLATISGGDIGTFLLNNVLPWCESVVDEIDEIDKSVSDLVHQSADVLHEDTADLFASIIASGGVLVAHLERLCAGDKNVLEAIAKWRELAEQGSQALEEITIPDDDEIPPAPEVPGQEPT